MRKFKCIGLKETNAIEWDDEFTIGSIYKQNSDYNRFGTIDLIGNDGGAWYVDADQFEEV